MRRLLLLWLLLGLTLVVSAQTIHKETVVWDFVNGVMSHGIYLEPGGGGTGVLPPWLPAPAVDDQLLVSGGASLAQWRTLPTTSVLGWDGATNSFTASAIGPGGVQPIGPAGTLQAAGGGGELAAYSGAACTNPLLPVMIGLTSTGTAHCVAQPSTALSAPAVLTSPSAEIPNGVNVGALAGGVLRSTVTGGVATLSTLPVPAGDLVGTSAPQELDNKRLNARVDAIPDTPAPYSFNLNLYDVAVAGALSQAKTLNDPTGVAKPLQLIRFLVRSTTPQSLAWGAAWSAEMGFALPTVTSGGGLYDTFWFQYNTASGKLDLIYSSQLAQFITPTGVTPGTYTCPQALSIDPRGRISSVTSGPCGGGGGATAAGALRDIQFKGPEGLAADSGNFLYEAMNHTLALANLRTSPGGALQVFRDPAGKQGYLTTPPLAQNRSWSWPDEDGVLCVKGGSCGGGGAALIIQEIDGTPSGTPTTLKVSNGALTNNGDGSFTLVTGVAGGGDFSSNTSTSVDSELVLFSGTGGKTGKRATGTGIPKLSGGVLSIATAGTDYVLPSGTVAAATALTANGANCSAGQAAQGVDALGNAEGCLSVAQVDAVADGTTKGIATFAAPDFNATAGVISLDYANGQAASAGVKGYLTGADWSTFNGKGDLSSTVSTSVDSELVLYSGATGKQAKRATGTGLAKVTAGVLSSVAAPTGVVLGDTDLQTVSGKRLTKRVTPLTSSTTYTCPGDTSDVCKMAMTGVAGTVTIAQPTGTPADSDMLLLRLRCTNAQTLSFHAIFIASPNIAVPTTCPADTSKDMVVGVMYSSDLTKWQILAVN
jgi:hypothetical protein